MDEITWTSVLTAYRNGASADFLWISSDETDESWGPLWTMPSCSVAAAERANRQIARMRARRLRHVRRARIRRLACDDFLTVVVITLLPGKLQQVRSLATGIPCDAPWLEDEVLATLRTALV